VREAFARNFRECDEVGAAVAVYLDGALVVDLWAGHKDFARTQPWQRDTLVNVYSTTKGVTALAAHRLVDEGKLDLDAPVAKYWPEFAQAGKGAIPVRFLLSHRAGLPAVRKLLPNEALYDWTAMTDALAAETPWWTPGSAHGYHAVTFGWLVGEVVRRIAGKSLGAYVRDTFARPLGLDFHIGLAEREHARVADILQQTPPAVGVRDRHGHERCEHLPRRVVLHPLQARRRGAPAPGCPAPGAAARRVPVRRARAHDPLER
jgi:CubicO group peptidase (beta-lactamase class C family)